MASAFVCHSYAATLEKGRPRFEVGDSVIVKCSHSAWKYGEIVKLWCQHSEVSMFYPYQVKLRSEEEMIYIPIDNDDMIQKIERSWLVILGEKDEFSDEELQSVRSLVDSRAGISVAQQQVQTMIEDMLWQQHRTYSKSAPQQDHGAFANKKPRLLSPLCDFDHNRSSMRSIDGWQDNCADCGEDPEAGRALAGQGDGHDDGRPPWRRLARRSHRFLSRDHQSDITNGTEVFSNEQQTRLKLELDYDDL